MDRLNTDKRNQFLGQGASGLIEDAFSIALIGFVMLGLGGVVYKALKPGGWLTQALDQVWNKSPWLVWLIGLAFGAMLLLGKWWVEHSPSAGRGGDALVYAFMALGLFFFFKLLVTGSL
jgi:hypothetical protein